MSSDPTLAALRRKIDGVDAAIITALAKRKKLELRVGAYKRKKGMKLLDTKRRKEMLAVRVRQAKKKGVQPDLAQRLFSLIHQHSLSTQKGRA